MNVLKRSRFTRTALTILASVVVYAAVTPSVKTDAMEQARRDTLLVNDFNSGLPTLLRTSFDTPGEFRFITPIAPNPHDVTADFDAALLRYLTVRICMVTATGCSFERTFTSTSSPDRLRIENKQGSFFIVNWTTGAGLDNTPIYRISVEVPGETLGSVDLPPRAYRQWGRTWPIKFIVEKDPALRIRLLSAAGMSLWEVADVLRTELGICDGELNQLLLGTYPNATAGQVDEVVDGVCQDVILPPTTKIADAATRNALAFYDLQTGRMLFASETTLLKNLRLNDVIASRPSAAAPYGYLRKVTSIRKDKGIYTIGSVQAKLTEAISQGKLQVSGFLAPSRSSGANALNSSPDMKMIGSSFDEGDQQTVDQPIDVTINLDGGDDEIGGTGTVRVTGRVFIKAGYNIGAGIELCSTPPLFVCADRVEAWMGFEQTSNLRIVGNFDGKVHKEKTVYPVPMEPIFFMIGPLPVILVPQLNVIVGVDGEAYINFEFAAQAESNMKPYLKWTDDEGWKDLSNIDPLSNTFFDADIDGTIRMEAYAKLDAALLLYGAIGPSMNGSLGIGGKAQSGASPLWEIFGHAKAAIGLRSIFTDLFDIGAPEETILDETFNIKSADRLAPVFSNVRTGRIPVDVGDPVFLGPRTSPASFQGYYEVRDPDGSSPPNITPTVDGQNLGLNPTFNTPGLRTVKIVATDSDNLSSEIFLAIDVRNSAPILSVTPSSLEVALGDQLFVTARAYDPEDGFLPCSRLTWTVTSPDVKSVSTDNRSCMAVIVFNAQGQRTVTVTATDSFGLPISGSTTIDVGPPPGNRKPVIDLESFKIFAATGPRSIFCVTGIFCEAPDDSLLFNGQAGDYHPPLTMEMNVTDPEGDPFNVVWFCQTGDQFAPIIYDDDGFPTCEPLYSATQPIYVYAAIMTPGGLGGDGSIVLGYSPVFRYTMLQITR